MHAVVVFGQTLVNSAFEHFMNNKIVRRNGLESIKSITHSSGIVLYQSETVIYLPYLPYLYYKLYLSTIIFLFQVFVLM